TLKTTPENAEGAIEKETQTVIYVYQKQETPVNPDNPNDGEQEDQTPGDPNGSTDSEGGDVVKTGDQTTIFTTMIIGLIALGGILVSIKSNKEKTYK
ncbi:MAG: LPXTG cell wall anchor domain-containing protein, partial [Clostridium paraputrificum]